MTPVTLNFTADTPVATGTPGSNSETGATNIHVHNGATNAAWVCINAANDNAIPTTCADPTCGGAAGVTCQLLNAGQEMNTGGAPFLNQGTNLTLHVRVDRPGFVASPDQRYVYLFTAYSRTIVVDGNNDWSDADDLLLSAGLGQKTYVAWDPNWIYFASQGPQLCTTCSSFYLDFYLRSTTNGGTMVQDVMPADPGAQLPTTNVNVHFWFKTDGSSEGVRVWNGTAWGVPLSPITYNVAFGGFATANGLVEYRVSRGAAPGGLGLTAANATLVLQSRVNNAGSSGFYAPYNAASPTPWQFIFANIGAANTPNSGVNICDPGTHLNGVGTACGP